MAGINEDVVGQFPIEIHIDAGATGAVQSCEIERRNLLGQRPQQVIDVYFAIGLRVNQQQTLALNRGQR
jgi:hypothetical protein